MITSTVVGEYHRTIKKRSSTKIKSELNHLLIISNIINNASMLSDDIEYVSTFYMTKYRLMCFESALFDAKI